ncbi:hypothetical protein EYF80_025525 [Liparis tanakae]|uniref:Uncharacterized protein n=1 Tax=Liparis tanakae TaxID=230148 RepID=A0A4Z2HH99_9TELE|nr:hypothetical protein EYF80_025525 [Liparis tanakae]
MGKEASFPQGNVAKGGERERKHLTASFVTPQPILFLNGLRSGVADPQYGKKYSAYSPPDHVSDPSWRSSDHTAICWEESEEQTDSSHFMSYSLFMSPEWLLRCLSQSSRSASTSFPSH